MGHPTPPVARSVGRKPTSAEPPSAVLAKLPEEPEKSSSSTAGPRPPAPARGTARDEAAPGR